MIKKLDSSLYKARLLPSISSIQSFRKFCHGGYTEILNDKRNIDGTKNSKTVDFGFKKISKESKPTLVNNVFDSVSKRYDCMNDIMSFGIHRIWKSELISFIDPPIQLIEDLEQMDQLKVPDYTILDLAGGTGDICINLSKKMVEKIPYDFFGRVLKSKIIVVDANQEMLNIGQSRAEESGFYDINWVHGVAEELKIDSNSIDLVISAFGVRNFTDINLAMKEIYRVLKPGGRLLFLEFSKVENPVFSYLYDLYSFMVIPKIGQLVAGDQASYQYLVESIRKFPNQEEFAFLLLEAGFRRVKFSNLTNGIVAIHSAHKIY